MEDKTPLVSVVIPAYNSAEWLPQAIDSVLAQSASSLEVIVVDDGSKDNTREVVERYVAADPNRVRYLPQANAGPSAARNNGIASAHGDWIAFLDADDWWDPGKLAVQLEAIGRDADIAAVFTDVRMSRDGAESPNKVTAGMATTTEPAQIFELILLEVCFPTTALVRKSDLQAIGCFNPSYRMGEDIDLWLRLFLGRKFCFVMQAMAVHRVIDSSLSRAQGTGKASAGLIRVYKDFLQLGPLVPTPFRARTRKAIAQHYFDWGWANMVGGEREAARLFASSWLHDPAKLTALKWIGLSLLPRTFTRKRMHSKVPVGPLAD